MAEEAKRKCGRIRNREKCAMCRACVLARSERPAPDPEAVAMIPQESAEKEAIPKGIAAKASQDARARETLTAKPGKRTKKPCWPVTYKWVAMGTLIAYTAIGGQKITMAQSVQNSGRSQTTPPQTQVISPTRRYDVPAGALEDILPAFESASGVHVALANAGIGKVQSPGVSGEYTVEKALGRLLDSTGVTYRFMEAGTVKLSLSAVQQSVTVNGDSLALDQVDSAKYTLPLLDTPQSISVVPQQIMSQQNTTTLRDALRNVAGISLAAGEGSSQGDNLTIRGFTARNDIFLDGMRDFGSYYRDTFNEEEVQVLEGPSAITFGRGTTGGVVNDVSKQPEMVPFMQGNATGGSDQTRRVALDFNEPLAKLGTGAAFRLNVMGDDNRVADRDVTQSRRYGFAPSLALGLGTSTRMIFSYFHQSESDIPDYGVPWLLNAPADVPRQNYYGFREANFLNTNDDIFTARIEHDVNDSVTIRNVIRYANEGRNAQITEPQVTTCAVPPAAPVAGCASWNTPPSAITVNRNQINVDSVETMLDDQLDATFRFGTGSVKHTVVAGLEGIRETSDPTRNTITGVPTTNLLNPNEAQPYAGTSTPSTAVQVTALTLGVYAIDTMQLGGRFELTAGGRWDDFDADYRQSIAPVAAFTQVVGLPSWRGALVYKPTQNGSIYFDVGNSYDPSAETLSLSVATASVPPEKNLTWEGGTKWNLLSEKLSVDGSVFRTDQTNVREPDPNDPTIDVLAGHERVNGFQAAATGYLTDRWELLASYAFLDSYVVSSQYYPQSIGAELANVPRNTFNFWSTYKLRWRGLQVGGGGNFVDARTASSTAPYVRIPTGVGANTVTLLKEAPSYWVFNAMVKYPLGERASLQVNLNNLSNNDYYDQIHPGHVVPGAGFAVLAGINFKF